jgi:hypothetical protein
MFAGGSTGSTIGNVGLTGLSGFNPINGSNRNRVRLVFEDGCTYSTDVTVGQAAITRRFSSYNATTQLCMSDDYCGDFLLAKDVYSEGLYEDFSTVRTNPCSVGQFCSGDLTRTRYRVKYYDKKWVRGYQYRQILLMAVLQGRINQQTMDAWLIQLKGDCYKVQYCQASLKLVGQIFSLFDAHYTFDEEHPGCGKLKCGLFSEYYCNSTLLPPIQVTAEPIDICTPVQLYAHHLVDWQKRMGDEFANFAGSELDNWLTTNRNDDRIYCTKVIFCLGTFKVVSTNLDFVNCPSSSSCDPNDFSANPQVVYCNDNCPIGFECLHAHSIFLPYPTKWPKFKGEVVGNRNIDEGQRKYPISFSDNCFAFSPNPFDQVLSFSSCLSDFESTYFIELVTLNGQRTVVYSENLGGNSYVISNLSNFNPGFYIAAVRKRTTGEVVHTQKLIKF